MSINFDDCISLTFPEKKSFDTSPHYTSVLKKVPRGVCPHVLVTMLLVICLVVSKNLFETFPS